METITRGNKIVIRSRVDLPQIVPEVKKTFLSRWRNYVNKENSSENRFKWVAMSMIIQSVLLTPIVGFVIISTGNVMFLWVLCVAAMYLTFIPSLSGLPIRNVLSTFLVSVAINIATVLIAIGINIF